MEYSWWLPCTGADAGRHWYRSCKRGDAQRRERAEVTSIAGDGWRRQKREQLSKSRAEGSTQVITRSKVSSGRGRGRCRSTWLNKTLNTGEKRKQGSMQIYTGLRLPWLIFRVIGQTNDRTNEQTTEQIKKQTNDWMGKQGTNNWTHKRTKEQMTKLTSITHVTQYTQVIQNNDN